MFTELDQVVEASRANGHHWFSPDTMRYFGTRLESPLIQGRWFITSECQDDATMPRMYTVRLVTDDRGTIETVGEFMAYATLAEAQTAIRRAIQATCPCDFCASRSLY